MSDPVKDYPAFKCRAGSVLPDNDHLAVEEPLEIRLGGRRFTVTMRTPGHDEELAAGFLLAEGFINSGEELGEIRRLRDSKGHPDPNALDVILKVPATRLRERLQRNFTISSSCGVCGKTSIEALERRISPLTSNTHINQQALFRMPALMRGEQAVFSATGGLHAAALFDVSSWEAADGRAATPPAGQDWNLRLIVLREDVGRHNAVDKVTGYALLHDKIPLNNAAMMVSGRVSFEIVQKAAAAGVAILCAVSAPTSLAVELAAELGMTLVGFLREPNFNVYAGQRRITC